jgi:hypothetical protein
MGVGARVGASSAACLIEFHFNDNKLKEATLLDFKKQTKISAEVKPILMFGFSMNLVC